MTEASQLIEQARELLARASALGAREFAGLADGDLIDLTAAAEAAGRLVDGIRCAVAAEVDVRSAYALGHAGLSFRLGHRRASALLQVLTRASGSEISRRLAVGAASRVHVDLSGGTCPPARPDIAGALADGSIGVDAALAIHRMLTQAERAHSSVEAVRGAEFELVESARTNPADYVRNEAAVWRDVLDPDGVEPREDDIHERRWLRLGRERNGLTPLQGELDQNLASLVRAAFTESMARDATPRFLDDADREAGTTTTECDDGVVIESLDDPRTREQRQHDVLLGLLTAGLRADGTELGGMRPLATVMATIDVEALATQKGSGCLEGIDEPVSAATIAMLACESGFRLSLQRDRGCPIDESPHRRYFSAAQRRALAVRDGGCAWPGCSAPPSQCHAHHIVYWSRGGRTTIDNGVLLCAEHHRMLHHSDIDFRMIDGEPRLVAPFGVDPGHVPLRGRRRRRRRAALQFRQRLGVLP